VAKKGASAGAWSSAVSDVVGGKAGGKGNTSIGNGTHPEKLDEALEAATKYLEKFRLP
jgi:alanyl-tRNA synthetase